MYRFITFSVEKRFIILINDFNILQQTQQCQKKRTGRESQGPRVTLNTEL